LSEWRQTDYERPIKKDVNGIGPGLFKTLRVPLKELTSTLHQDTRIPGRDRIPDIQNTKQNTSHRLVIYSRKQSM